MHLVECWVIYLEELHPCSRNHIFASEIKCFLQLNYLYLSSYMNEKSKFQGEGSKSESRQLVSKFFAVYSHIFRYVFGVHSPNCLLSRYPLIFVLNLWRLGFSKKNSLWYEVPKREVTNYEGRPKFSGICGRWMEVGRSFVNILFSD